VVAQALRDGDANVRSTAIRTLGTMGTAQARELIVGMSRSHDTDDRRAAAANLRRFDDTNATRRLTEMIRDPDPTVAYSAIDAVADRPEAQTAIRALVGDTNVPYYTRREAAQLLSYRGVTDATIDAVLSSNATEYYDR